MQDTFLELSPEEQRQGWRLVRTCDAYELLGLALEDALARGTMEHGEQDVENARAELRILQEDA
jgi:hypothetical protein